MSELIVVNYRHKDKNFVFVLQIFIYIFFSFKIKPLGMLVRLGRRPFQAAEDLRCAALLAPGWTICSFGADFSGFK